MACRIAPGTQRRCPWCALRDADCARAYAAAVGVIAHALVAACSACAGVICVDVAKQCIAVCTYAWVQGVGGVQDELVML